jgi:hypothetical protein
MTPSAQTYGCSCYAKVGCRKPARRSAMGPERVSSMATSELQRPRYRPRCSLFGRTSPGLRESAHAARRTEH